MDKLTNPDPLVRRVVGRHGAAVRRRKGSTTRVRTVAGTFVLAETGPPGPLFTPAVALLERALPRFYDGRFTTHPDAAVTVLFFQTPASYQTDAARTFPDAGATLGIFRHGPREIDVDLANGEAYLPTLTHEVVHVLTEADFPEARGADRKIDGGRDRCTTQWRGRSSRGWRSAGGCGVSTGLGTVACSGMSRGRGASRGDRDGGRRGWRGVEAVGSRTGQGIGSVLAMAEVWA